MRRALLLLPIVIAFASVGMLVSGGRLPARAATVSIEVGNLYFCDVSQQGVCETTVTAGDTVTWNNVAGFHTVTECDDTFSTCPPAGGFDSGNLLTGNSFSHTFNSPGAFEYFCMFHPTDMRGRVTVQVAPTPTPTPVPTAAPSGSTAASPTATAAPAAVPKTGGDAADGDGTNAEALALVVLGGVLLAAAVTSVRAAARSRG